MCTTDDMAAELLRLVIAHQYDSSDAALICSLVKGLLRDRDADAGWRTMDSAPKDGTRILIAGKWNDPSSPSFGRWTVEIFSWCSVYSDGDLSKCEWWSGMETMKHWAVDWLKWRPLPSPPTEHTPEEET